MLLGVELIREHRGSLVRSGDRAGTIASGASAAVRVGGRVAADGGDVLVVYDASVPCRREVRSVQE